MTKDTNYHIYGIHPVLHILQTAPERIVQIETSEKLQQKHKFPKVKVLSHGELNHKYQGINHQSLVALVKAKKNHSLDDLISDEEIDKILILDRISDAGNCGAIIRSAAAFGISKIILPKHDALTDLGILAKASAGFSETRKFAEVTNLTKAIDQLKENGYWCIGLDGEAKASIESLRKFNKVAVVLGNEGKGIKDLVKKHCDLLVKIPTDPNVESLNVAAAAAIALYCLGS